MAKERTVRKEILLRPDEWERIRARARECGMRPGVFLREVALGAAPKARPYQAESEAVRQLTRLGCHLDLRAQIATRNGEVERAQELRTVKEEVMATIRQLA